MESLTKKDMRGSGSGYSYGDGSGYGSGSGYGAGYGYGDGYGDGCIGSSELKPAPALIRAV